MRMRRGVKHFWTHKAYKWKKPVSCLVAVAVICMALGYAGDRTLTVQATTSKQVQDNIDKLNQQIDQINQNIGTMEERQEILEEEMEDLNAEILNTMTSIGMKEEELEDKAADLEQKARDIDRASDEYEKAKEKETKQYDDMVVRLRKMYENGEKSGMELLIAGAGFADLLSQMDFVESVYSYDRMKLTEFTETKNEVLDLWNQLEDDKHQLELEKRNLELEKIALEAQKGELDTLLARKKSQSANYEAEIKKARQEANVAKKQLQQEKEKLKKLQQGGSKAAAGTYTSDYNAVIDGAEGSSLGKQIAKYACQYIGNPYVPGGTSLTNGADCSGFTYRVYSDFGYSLPRTSTEQRSAGKGVEYSQAQPGDLICYSGHVALYIGQGMIVHASTQKTGIKVGNAQYRPILAVRRII